MENSHTFGFGRGRIASELDLAACDLPFGEGFFFSFGCTQGLRPSAGELGGSASDDAFLVTTAPLEGGLGRLLPLGAGLTKGDEILFGDGFEESLGLLVGFEAAINGCDVGFINLLWGFAFAFGTDADGVRSLTGDEESCLGLLLAGGGFGFAFALGARLE